MTKAWDKFKLTLTGLSSEELDILGAEYDKYRQERYKWEWDDDAVLSFGDWYIVMADNIKDNREGK